MASIAVDGLVKRYGSLVAVDDVSFSVEPGEVFALLGPNGAGKTTTVEILEGLRSADAGTATVLGESAGTRRLASRVGVMPQESDLYMGIRTQEAVRLFASFYDETDDTEQLMERLDLQRVRRTTYRRLSGGERRRLSLALALVGRPDVAFLDEPTTGMDVEGRTETWQIVRELRERGTSVVLTTHLLDEAERVADRVGIMHRGRLVALGSPAELAGAARTLTFTTATAIDPETLGAFLGTTVTTAATRSYRVDAAVPTPELVSRLTTWLSARAVLVLHLDASPRSLEDVYLDLTR